MKILIMVPIQPEIDFLLQACTEKGFHTRDSMIGRLPVVHLPELDVTLACGGLGKVQFAVQTQYLLDVCPGWDLLICAGAAGALVDELSVGDVIVATETVEHDIHNKFGKPLLPKFSGAEAVVSALRSVVPLCNSFQVHFGPIASGDEDVVDIDRRRLPFGQGAFDFVFCVHALHHFDDPATFIRQARRVIRAGGALAIIGMDPQREPDQWYLYDYFPGTRETDRGRYPSGDVILHWMETASFVRCERRLAARIEHDFIGSEVLNDPILQKNGTSQLALLTEEAFENGMARIREALRLAESSGEKIVFRTRIALPAVIGFVPDTGESRPGGVWIHRCAGGCSPRWTGSRSQVIPMIKSPVQAVVFDFDYTLADSSRGVVECINFALDSLSLPTVSAERARQTIGLSLADTFVHLAGEVTAAQGDEFIRLFIKRADEVMADLTILFESVPQTIAVLKEQGLGLGIVSTKFRYRIESILKREGLLDLFDVIVGGEDVPNQKPDPEGLRWAMGRLGRSPLDCVYVGDSVVDAETAGRARVPFVAVLSGVTSREAFGAYDVRQVLEHVCDLPGWLGH